ncbi:hypothetical protein ElyMa_006298400 [Elysia marginata]|uniref:Uncharacterized protein n=1 Tax=Elysia marginata TaxID=1093978 RepID=A0AAV4HE79_9GAST|nr:hypothetical protein ElyMa_006298400 [Elysia marginata]
MVVMNTLTYTQATVRPSVSRNAWNQHRAELVISVGVHHEDTRNATHSCGAKHQVTDRIYNGRVPEAPACWTLGTRAGSRCLSQGGGE